MLPQQQRKSMMICARTDQTTYRDLRRAADSAGLRLTDWIRTRLAQAARRELT
ncbi:MAG TPA: hypothetical protein VMS30_04050 [Phycisphaerales bacterium]|nr:hypothetical protein [Phycisphaerales bacterium]